MQPKDALSPVAALHNGQQLLWLVLAMYPRSWAATNISWRSDENSGSYNSVWGRVGGIGRLVIGTAAPFQDKPPWYKIHTQVRVSYEACSSPHSGSRRIDLVDNPNRSYQTKRTKEIDDGERC